mmetsp:Transcript_12311/g.33066  ORF Transcript_12311/g.33066 Transcript_12311/m.33066 type:complete len:214 (-) Transcript_12311:128-769(-)|eukprot:CAMPEP_0177211340 /NCGR_PEP_ID=MMETSP0367-20130122/32044_1 /TAXON_ID=447022 ORGANISM="Scrippsiella hangoei-like, Strain SHHI-4" /NCGR_SAMPLE_ID=MMETSP0367 /ASSEMBLY_ACC=CAM_ASM_000362 /LENGTH=213 /DNA_ID=CAMNT_0018660527 /DNA_START=67 /DNA_END=708 /DNA_ORIENTATION=-
MFGGVSRAVAQGARRVLAPARQSARPTLMAHQPVRPFSVVSTFQRQWLGQTGQRMQAAQCSALASSVLPKAQPQVQQAVCKAAGAMEAQVGIESLKSEGMVFEIGVSFVFLHYQSIFIGVMRCLFQSFRPLLILFVFGQILKAVFFIAGAPIWLSFYSIWLFEVIYGLAQCAISFIFISFFYNNLSFARLRPSLSYMIRQQRDKFSRVCRALA